uniref:nicotinamide riboside kinase 1-like isoform X1 n=1 Tax=Ciona intestinalis TaxID=7719 RepID=UPI0000522204|nr:nicotinamide riboside kinase 1-like isoform X1 [Ciona intestinalis]XP_026689871.1 nicotinamide riboside kinase 1-like isoform X1 [Ciona intestinalis]|eukprot:XP_004225951.1 nicotinamide riboside kinase 1-like isoform X1 [Ciona intestinalis]
MGKFHKSILVVGISGVSNGGKTTLANHLKEYFGWKQVHVKVLHQDDYYKEEVDIPVNKATGILNWDVLEAFDCKSFVENFDSALSDLKALAEDSNDIENGVSGFQPKTSVLIIEGILLYNQDVVNKWMDKKYFLTLPYEEAKRRRKLRVYEPPDVPGMFDLSVWPMYLKHVDEIREVHKISGLQSKDAVFAFVKQDLKHAITKT